jgi:CHAD domain-containing protein
LIDYYKNELNHKNFKVIKKRFEENKYKIINDESEKARSLGIFKDKMQVGEERIDTWPLGDENFKIIKQGLKKTYRRGRKAMHKAYTDSTTENFHEWRKRVKYHWYHLRLLTYCWPEVLENRRNEVHRLSEQLGNEHDLAILRQTLLDAYGEYCNSSNIQVLIKLIDRRRVILRGQAVILGRKIFCEKS